MAPMSGEQRAKWAWVVLVVAPLSGVSCTKKSDAPLEPELAPSSSAASAITAPSVESSPVRMPLLPYRSVHELAANSRVFPLTNGVVICVDCEIREQPNNDRKLFTFDGVELKELPGLLSDKKISAAFGASINQELKPLKGGDYRFTGTLPQPLLVEAYGQDYEDDNARDGTATISHYFVKRGTTWARADTDTSKFPSTHPPGWDTFEQPRGLPRAFDDAMLHAPALHGWTLSGGDGPLLLARDEKLDRWNGHTWETHDAPWQKVRLARRLTDGRSIVLAAGQGLFAISAEGEIERVDVRSERHEYAVLLIEGKPWLATDRALYVPQQAETKLAPLPAREPNAERPKPPSLAEVTAGTAAAPSAAPSVDPPAPAVGVAAAESIPPMTAFGESCRTPFVVLFTPPESNWRYYDAAQNLSGAVSLQDSLWFAEFTRKSTTYFGAQASDEATARALMLAYVEKVPKGKPILGCLDLKAYVPDPYRPKWDAKRILINLRAGQLL